MILWYLQVKRLWTFRKETITLVARSTWGALSLSTLVRVPQSVQLLKQLWLVGDPVDGGLRFPDPEGLVGFKKIAEVAPVR